MIWIRICERNENFSQLPASKKMIATYKAKFISLLLE